MALAELVDEEVAQRPQLDLRALVAELRQRADSRHPPVVQGVTLASLHAAKGLEWDAVFLVGLADGTLPISHALSHGPDSEQVEEERRLFYVGITRARVHLALSWALARTPGGRQGRRPSRFLNGIAPQSQRDDGPSRPRKPRGPAPRCRVCNAALTSPAGDHAAPVRELPVRPRRTTARRPQGLAAADLQGDERACLRGVHRQHLDRDRRSRCRPTTPRWSPSRASAPASSNSSVPTCSPWSKAAKLRKNTAKPAGQKFACGFRLVPSSLRYTLTKCHVRKEGVTDMTSNYGVYRRKRCRHVADPPCPRRGTPRASRCRHRRYCGAA